MAFVAENFSWPRMDFQKTIIDFLGIQGVIIEDIKLDYKKYEVRIIARQKREECSCSGCGLQLVLVKDWQKKELKAPPLGKLPAKESLEF